MKASTLMPEPRNAAFRLQQPRANGPPPVPTIQHPSSSLFYPHPTWEPSHRPKGRKHWVLLRCEPSQEPYRGVPEASQREKTFSRGEGRGGRGCETSTFNL